MINFNTYQITLSPTRKCNYSCDYCFQIHENNNLDITKLYEALKKLESFIINKFNKIEVILIGGEITTHKDILQICKIFQTIFKNYILEFFFMVNGSNINTLISLDKSFSKSTFFLSYHSSQENSFDSYINNLLTFKNKCIVNIMLENNDKFYNEINYIINFVENNKTNILFEFSPLFDNLFNYQKVTENKNILNIYNKKLKKEKLKFRYCSGFLNSIFIEFNYDIKPCININTQFKKINIFDSSFDSYFKKIIESGFYFCSNECFDCSKQLLITDKKFNFFNLKEKNAYS